MTIQTIKAAGRGILYAGDQRSCELRASAYAKGGVHGPIQANAGGERVGAAQAIAEIQGDLHETLQAQVAFKRNTEQQFKDMQAAIDHMAVLSAAAQLGRGQPVHGVPVDREYTSNFNDWLRNGASEQEIRAANQTGLFSQINASMSVGTDSAGGYLAPIEWDRTIAAALRTVSPMRRLASVKTTTVRAYTTLWNLKGMGSGWVGETAARSETATPTFAPIIFDHGEIYANPAATQQLLDDAETNFEQFITDEVEEEFSIQESLAFISGNGTNKPRGLLTYAPGGVSAAVHPGGALSVTTAAATTAVTTDELKTLYWALPAPYRPGGAWLMNSNTASVVDKLKDGQGNYIWRDSLSAGQPATLLGRPVEFDENMPDMVAGAIPIAFGDFKKGYLINDRKGLRVLRDPYTNKPFTHFYCVKRVGGGVRDPKAIRLLKMAAS
jgi:HK97 family phage major capsid protein